MSRRLANRQLSLFLVLVWSCEREIATRGPGNNDGALSETSGQRTDAAHAEDSQAYIPEENVAEDAADTSGPDLNDSGITTDARTGDVSLCRGLRFLRQDYASRTGFNFGHSWMMAWGRDGKTYTNFSDGKFFENDWQTNALLTIDDDPPNISATSFTKISANPLQREGTWAYYITNTILIGDTLYVAIVDIAPQGLGAQSAGIGRSDDKGKTITFDRTRPMWPKTGTKPFVYPTFLQNGPGYGGNTDGFMYVYGTEGDWGGLRGGTNTIRLARISVKDDLLDVTKYEYFTGSSWSPSIDLAQGVLSDGKNLGGMQSVLYNTVLQRYFLITFAEVESTEARMVLYDAPQPWGPWFRCGVIPGHETVFQEDRLFHTAYNPSFNAKWVTSTGTMWISYSNYTPQYTFHYGLVTIDL